MKISFFESTQEEEKKIGDVFKKYDVNFIHEPLSMKNVSLAKDSEIIGIFIYSKIDKKILDELPNLKMIATQSTGYDHIDLKECKKRHIFVSNVPTYGENTVAEHAFALILDLSRNIHKAFLKTQRDDLTLNGLEGFDLKGKTIGVIGVGNIGTHVIRIANGFEMKILAYDKHKNRNLKKKINFTYTSLNNLLKKSDIITLHLPLNPKTKHIINKKTLRIMKPNCIIINTSRGDLIKTKDLLGALDSGKILGAGLDVLEGEKVIKEEKELLHNTGKEHTEKLKKIIDSYMILHNEKVIFTPHIAFYSHEALMRIFCTTVENIKNFIRGKPQNLVRK